MTNLLTTGNHVPFNLGLYRHLRHPVATVVFGYLYNVERAIYRRDRSRLGQPFKVPTYRVCKVLGVTSRQVRTARDKLAESGLIGYEQQAVVAGGSVVLYRIYHAKLREILQADTPDSAPDSTGQEYQIPT